MSGLLCVKLMQYSNAWDRKTVVHKDRLTIKVLAWIPLVPIIILAWVMEPIIKIHAGLNIASKWLRKVSK